MGFLDLLGDAAKIILSSSSSSPFIRKAINYGETTIGGGHDHRYNKGKDRTPAQKKADAEKKKD